MKPVRNAAVVAVLLAGAILPSLVVAAEPQAAVRALPAANTDAVKVPIYQSRVLTTRAPVKRISVGNPGIADILITTRPSCICWAARWAAPMCCSGTRATA